MNWRAWIHSTLTSCTPLLAVVPAERIFAAGSIDGIPSKPFVVFHFGEVAIEMPGVLSQYGTVWAYDNDGSYETVDSILKMVRDALVGQATSWDGAGICRWEGESGELADDVYDAITRNATFRLIGEG